jgi:TetR/AcrR family transcriptional repressor of mexCD-oprJ operon
MDALAVDPEASMVEIARRAGVVRATIYMHFPTRDALIDAVTVKAIAEATTVIERAEPERGDPVEALRRVISAAWQSLSRFHALVTINTRRPYQEIRDHHGPALAALQPLIERGQHAGAFRADVPASWHLAMLLALIHAASGELRNGTITEKNAESALLDGVIGAVRTTPEALQHDRLIRRSTRPFGTGQS